MEKTSSAVQSWLSLTVEWWKRVQVEFHGQFSIERMLQLKFYHASSTAWRAMTILALTPLPSLLITLAIECIRMNDPRLGVKYALPFFGRVFCFVVVIDFLVLYQCRLIIPALPRSNVRLFAVSCISAFGTVAYLRCLSSAIGFPVPLTLLVGSPVTSTIFTAGMLLSWGTFLRHNPTERYDLINYILVVCIQLLVTYVYPAYAFAFVRIKNDWQILFACLLPVIKRVVKSTIGHIFRNKPDLKSDMVVLNADIYHVLFVSWCMNGARSTTNTIFFVLMDLAESALALFHVNKVLQELQGTIGDIDLGSKTKQKSLVHPMQSNHQPFSLLNLAAAIWEAEKSKKISHPRIRVKSDIQLLSNAKSTSVRGVAKSCSDRTVMPTFELSRCQSYVIPCALTANQPTFNQHNLEGIMVLSSPDRQKCLEVILRLLHITEFLLLVEFIEVVVPTVYALYLAAIYRLPNRKYFEMFQDITEEQHFYQIASIIAYALLELGSFLLLCVFLRRKLGLSPLRQLSFVLESQWQNSQVKLVLWVVYAVQSRLEHYGTDFTFQFKWLDQRHEELQNGELLVTLKSDSLIE